MADRFGRDVSRAVAVGGEPPLLQQQDPVGKADREVDVVQDRDHGGAALGAAARALDQIDLVPQVEARCRLIQQQEPRTMHGLAAGQLYQYAGEMGALLLAAGQRRQLPAAETLQPDFVQRGVDQPTRRSRGCVDRLPSDDLLDREREGDINMLREHRAMRASSRGEYSPMSRCFNETRPRSGAGRRRAAQQC